MSARLAFFGTDAFAAPSLRALAAAGHRVDPVVCQPDRPRGRGHQPGPCPVKETALELGLRVEQPASLREPAALEGLLADAPDLACVVAYGQILPTRVLRAPRLGCVNLHASLLPRWRGAAPIERALAAGDAETGVCVQRMVEALDAGEILACRRRVLGDADRAEALRAELALEGAELLAETVCRLLDGPVPGTPQDESLATYAPKLGKADGVLDFTRTRRELLNRARAFAQRPGLFTEAPGGGLLRVLDLEDGDADGAGRAGEVLELGTRGLKVACADGSVWLPRVRPDSGKTMAAADFARGRGWAAGARFGVPRI